MAQVFCFVLFPVIEKYSNQMRGDPKRSHLHRSLESSRNTSAFVARYYLEDIEGELGWRRGWERAEESLISILAKTISSRWGSCFQSV